MSHLRTSSLDALAAEVVTAGVAPAAAVGVAFRGASGWKLAVGAAGASPDGPIDSDAVFDLASVSKPFFALAAARSAQASAFDLQAPLARYFPEFAGTPTGSLAGELFLAHRAGLEAHRSLFRPLVARVPVDPATALQEAARARRPEAAGAPREHGYPPVYSDLGYALLGRALERARRAPLDRIIADTIAAPLALDVGSARQWLHRRADFHRRVLPTEFVRFRGGSIRGIVHDENAWALSGHACSGHAGLFGTVRGVLGFGAAVLDAMAGRRLDWLSPAWLTPLVRERPGGTLRAGFDGKSDGASSAGTLSSASTFGHLGFTGTSLWCDPLAEAVTVLLTNRVCPSRENQRIREARPRTHDALWLYARKQGLLSPSEP